MRCGDIQDVPYAGFARAKTGNLSRSTQDGQQGKQDLEVIVGQSLRRLIGAKLPECAEFSSVCKGAEGGAQLCYVTLFATQQADEKTSRLVALFRVIALVQ